MGIAYRHLSRSLSTQKSIFLGIKVETLLIILLKEPMKEKRLKRLKYRHICSKFEHQFLILIYFSFFYHTGISNFLSFQYAKLNRYFLFSTTIINNIIPSIISNFENFSHLAFFCFSRIINLKIGI